MIYSLREAKRSKCLLLKRLLGRKYDAAYWRASRSLLNVPMHFQVYFVSLANCANASTIHFSNLQIGSIFTRPCRYFWWVPINRWQTRWATSNVATFNMHFSTSPIWCTPCNRRKQKIFLFYFQRLTYFRSMCCTISISMEMICVQWRSPERICRRSDRKAEKLPKSSCTIADIERPVHISRVNYMFGWSRCAIERSGQSNTFQLIIDMEYT